MFSHPLLNPRSAEPSPNKRRALTVDRPVALKREPCARPNLARMPERLRRLYRVALSDIESNLVEADGQRYFGAGQVFGPMVYTRDIAYSGVLGLNRLYPETMDASLRYTRKLRAAVGFKVPESLGLDDDRIPWEPVLGTEGDFMRAHHTNSFARRTDDVVWLWAAHDLYRHHPRLADWGWLLATGTEFFDRFYRPFRDDATGLYRGQASFIDIHYGNGNPSSGYPLDWSIGDCLKVFAASTNALYIRGMDVLADAAGRLGLSQEAERWADAGRELRQAARAHLVDDDDRIAFYRTAGGELSPRSDALGVTLCVLLGVCRSPASANAALDQLTTSPHGLSLIQPPFDHDHFYHNHSSWPFVEAFYYRARHALGDREALHTGIERVAESCTDEGSFFELCDVRSGEHAGSTRQLWSASAFAGLCVDRFPLVAEAPQ